MIVLNVIFLFLVFWRGGYNFEFVIINDVNLCLFKINVVTYYMFVYGFRELYYGDL